MAEERNTTERRERSKSVCIYSAARHSTANATHSEREKTKQHSTAIQGKLGSAQLSQIRTTKQFRKLPHPGFHGICRVRC